MMHTLSIDFSDGSGITYFDIPEEIIDEITLGILADYRFSLKV